MGTSFGLWIPRPRRSGLRYAGASALLQFVAACGGHGGLVNPPGISVSLPISTVTITQNGSSVIIPIQINSTSETAIVMVGGLPGGVTEKYSSTDTNPSGTLAFMANGSAMTGMFTPTVNVQSAGSTASTSFTLVVKMQ